MGDEKENASFMDLAGEGLAELDSTSLNRFSRQNAALGAETTAKLIRMKVIVVGCRGVGIETAKNLALQGVGAITLVDASPTAARDTGCNFFLFDDDAKNGTPRVVASAPRLQELNPMCAVKVADSLTNELICSHNALVITQYKPFPELIALDNYCRENKVSFFYAYTGGISASIFVDHGPNHVVTDPNGERPVKKLITDVTPLAGAAECLVRYDTPDGGEATGIDSGHYEISEVEGIDGINGGLFEVSHPYSDPVKTIRISFAAKEGSAYVKGGILVEKKVAKAHPMEALSVKLKSPGDAFSGTLTQTDLLSFSEHQQHLAFAAVNSFAIRKGGMYPRVGSEEDAAEVVAVAKSLLAEKEVDLGEDFEVDEKLVRRTALFAAVELQPMSAFIGGVLAQEVVKCTGKFTPMPGFMHFSAPETLPADYPLGAALCAPRNHRNDELAAVFGWPFVESLGNLKYFMVGCGALGCEFMKNFALNGLFCGPEGRLVVTDADRIELSNLSRQFLFREHNVGQPKSRAAGAMATVMNANFKVTALELFVGPKSEDTFNDDFWLGLDGVCNALDNMEARLYVDAQCVKYEKSLLESGTMGTSGNIDTISPHKTKTYADGGNAAEGGGVPMCTLRNFPHLTDHCIEWARDQFALLFVKLGKAADNYLSLPAAFEREKLDLTESEPSIAIFEINSVRSLVRAAKAPSMQTAAQLAWDMFHYLFRDRILDLQALFPRDSRMVDEKTGADQGPFWSEKKRYPTVAMYDEDDETHTGFMLAATCLFAVLLGVEPPKREEDTQWLAQYRTADKAWIKATVKGLSAPVYTPVAVARPGEAVDDEALKAAKRATCQGLLEALRYEAAQLPSSGLPQLEPADFEKDDDLNFHIEFTTTCANLRCDNYAIKRTDFQACKVIAGKIIAAIATTTAAVCGLVMLELFKLAQSKPADDLMNRQIGLAVNNYTSFSQDPPKKLSTFTERIVPAAADLPPDAFDENGKIKEEYVESTVKRAYPEGHSVWDKLPCPASITLKEFAAWLLEQHGLKLGSWDFVYGTKKGSDGAVNGVSTRVFPPKPQLDYSLLPALDLTKAQAMQALMKTPAASRAVQQYLALWAECKEKGAVPTQPTASDLADVITESSTLLQVLNKMARVAEDALASGAIDSKTVTTLAGRRFWLLPGKDTPACSHAETGEDIENMAAIKFIL